MAKQEIPLLDWLGEGRMPLQTHQLRGQDPNPLTLLILKAQKIPH